MRRVDICCGKIYNTCNMTTNIRDIASHLHISAATVSRSLRQDPMIHPQTRARVIEAAMRLGYQGRARRTARVQEDQKTLAVVLPCQASDTAHLDLNMARYIQGITAAADSNRVILQLKAAAEHMAADAGALRPVSVLPERGIGPCDAAILVAHLAYDTVANLMRHTPVVGISQRHEGLRHDCVLADNIGGTYRLTVKLIDVGHRRMAWVGDWYSATFFDARQAGFLQACIQNRLAADQRFIGPELFDAEKNVRGEVLVAAVREGVTGFVCGNDRVALQVISALESAGIHVPGDVSVTGFDAQGILAMNGKTLTTVEPNFIEMGRAAVKLALQRLEDPSAIHVEWTVDSTLVPGQTIGVATSR